MSGPVIGPGGYRVAEGNAFLFPGEVVVEGLGDGLSLCLFAAGDDEGKVDPVRFAGEDEPVQVQVVSTRHRVIVVIYTVLRVPLATYERRTMDLVLEDGRKRSFTINLWLSGMGEEPVVRCDYQVFAGELEEVE